ncbi:uncharacterized protein ATC70_012432 [Mucor velutinosus]|uniref:Something about silencing protein 4 domain-containing protein n=1 Tax=Mucor velutinosus TaxID=708070 RepID=A0AAN7D5I2_9FUNG|nr:hypothetical protein ATC70_012432 [Mucor velutinosus]
MESKRELPTRHNFLTEAVQSYLESKNATTGPTFDMRTILTVTSDASSIQHFEYHENPAQEPPSIIEHMPHVKVIEPIISAKKTKKAVIVDDDIIDDEYYLKRHRRHELDEKKQKNREKERLKHGYYQQKQLVERIKTMDKNLLRSIVSSIRHRTHKNEDMSEEEEEKYLEDLHTSLLREAQEHLDRYETLGIGKSEEEPDQAAAMDQTPTISDEFTQALKTEEKLQRQRQIRSFSGRAVFTGAVASARGSRRSTRNIIAFGQLLPPFEIVEFELPKAWLENKN